MTTSLPVTAFNLWLIFTVLLIAINLGTYIWLIREKAKSIKWEEKHIALEQKLAQHVKYYDDLIDILIQKNPLITREIKEILVEHYKSRGKLPK